MSDSFNIIVGDPGGDGHGHTDTQLISTAMTYSDVENAWQAVNDKLDQKYGFNLYDLCQEYEDCLLTKEQSDALIDAGVPLSSIVDPAYAYRIPRGSDAEFALSSDCFIDLVLWLLNDHEPLLALSRSAPGRSKDLHIGGYGLFID
jgi:hypothetical protein